LLDYLHCEQCMVDVRFEQARIKIIVKREANPHATRSRKDIQPLKRPMKLPLRYMSDRGSFW
jgi:hypothetical protein